MNGSQPAALEEEEEQRGVPDTYSRASQLSFPRRNTQQDSPATGASFHRQVVRVQFEQGMGETRLLLTD
ncbi:hypothetical protein EPR50_G00101890 [Perca flavescens]|uniref:Uncharacterized protein n=1 Tax=Perca flavescens TaxID=8167 RepID=A0A484D0Q0_PERFV|nr:hypothetical protein EPR50_G00101890 [Perca flavescens]